jgi:TatD DNase family protein
LHPSGALNDLFDIGANLTHDSFAGDLQAVLSRAARVGVHRMLVTGATLAGSIAGLELARHHRGRLWATAGVHPHHASDYDSDCEDELTRLHRDPLVLAVGECGLDYNRNHSTPAAQQFAFERQIKLAQACGKPLFLHQRDAHADFMAILKAAGALPPLVVHCFTGRRAELEDYLTQDWYVGITGWICDERRGQHLLDDVCLIPDDRLLIETDAPYLLPRTLHPKPRDRRCEPAHLTEVLRVVAQARRQSIEHVAALSTANAQRLFQPL